VRALLIVALLAQLARADPRVVIVETKGAPSLPMLASQVMVHANASVTVKLAPDADPLTFAETASGLVAGREADLVVWTAPVDGGYLVFVAGRTTGRALTELARVDANIGTAEIERTVALKIASLLDVMNTPAPVATVLAAPVHTTTRDAWRVEVDGFVAYEAHERAVDGRVAILGGRTWRRGTWTFVPMVGGYWQPSATIERPAGRASILEIGGTLAGEVDREVGPVELFVRPRFVAAAVHARGVSTDGRRGRVTVFAPYAGFEVGAFRHVVSNVAFGLVGGCDFALIRRTLVIDDDTVVDLGAARVHVGLSLTVSL
jgi:hypothetical protein